MKILQLLSYGKIESKLAFAEVEKPIPGDDQVLLEVYSASVNPVDYKLVEGWLKMFLKLPLPTGIGYDVAGIVVEKGINVSGIEIGDEVMAVLPSTSPGSFAEYIVIDSNIVASKPNNIDFQEASGIPMVGLTTVQCFKKANIKAGSSVLIHAGSGGVGTFAIQYAKAKGAFVYTTTSTKNVGWVKELGADRVIDYTKENYVEVINEVDFVIDTLGGPYTKDAFKIIKKGGTVVNIVGMKLDDETAQEWGLNRFMRFILSLLRYRIAKAAKEKSAFYKTVIMLPNASQLKEIKEMIEEGLINTLIDKIFPFSDAVKAVLYQKTGRAKGKVIIQVKK
jgi:NADPH:quinone reductase-like Zn-dependent oxidoreductase